MRGISIAKALLIPLVVIIGLTGAILTLYGGIKMFRLSGQDVFFNDNAVQLRNFVDCDYQATAFANNTLGSSQSSQNQTNEFKGAVADYCKAQQRPFIYLVCVTAAMVVLSVMMSLCVGWKIPRSWLYFLAIHNAITMALLFVLIFAYMVAIKPAYQLVDCGGMNENTINNLNNAGVGGSNSQGAGSSSTQFGCWRGDNLPTMSSARMLFNNILPCLWIGIAFSIFALFLFNLLLSSIWHAKGRGYGPRYVGGAPSSYGPGTTTGAPGTMPTGPSPYFYR